MLKKQASNKVIIKKRKNKTSGEGFHGGSWKLAYADFVTALMAFFLLLWLLNTTPNKKLKVIEQYFMPTLTFLTKEVQKDGSQYNEKIGIKEGVNRVGDIVDISRKGQRIDISEIENKMLTEMESKIKKTEKKNASANKALSYHRTADGLEITIHDHGQYKVFDQENAQLTDFGKSILNKVTNIIKVSPNLIQVVGYANITNSSIDHYGSWELSADRANVARKFLLISGISADKIQEVVARINPINFTADDSYSKKEARIAITILRNSAIMNQKISVPQDGRYG